MTSKGLLNSLSEEEWMLVTSTERAALADLDEDELVELHTRVRRARTRYVKQYRRGASARIPAAGGRGKARPQNRRAADKAELFEDALARVSSALAAVARRSAAELRTERLAVARANRGSGPGSESQDVSGVGRTSQAKGREASTRTPSARKKVASTQATGARRQAKRDNR